MISWSSFVVTHEKGRHGLACPPSVDVSRGHREPGSEVLGYMLEAEVLLDVLLPSPLGNRVCLLLQYLLQSCSLIFTDTMDLSWDLGKNLMAP